MALYTVDWLRELPPSRRDALYGFDDDHDGLISSRDFGDICLAAANDGMTVREWLEIAIETRLADFEEREPGILPGRTRFQ